jgi:hypothetical protein
VLRTRRNASLLLRVEKCPELNLGPVRIWDLGFRIFYQVVAAALRAALRKENECRPRSLPWHPL